MLVSERLRSLRKEKGLSLEQVAEMIGTSRQTIHRYETGVITNIPPDKIEALALVLETTPQHIMGWNNDSISSYNNILAPKTKKLPILGEIACGKPIYAEQEHESYVISNGNVSADFCLKARGDSMIGARIYDGDIVFIKSQSFVDNGEIAAVIIGDEATLKRVYYYPQEEKLILSAENPRYAPLVYMGEELDRIRIIGKAIAFQSLIL